jgi:hypothetical protein
MYAVFKNDKQIGRPFHSEKEVWEAALIQGLVKDLPVADEEGGQVLPLDIMPAEFTKLAARALTPAASIENLPFVVSRTQRF